MRRPGPLEIWGGIECSHLRIFGETRDQLVATGHADREADLDLIAQLGLKTVRYPVLWERNQPRPGPMNWTWQDRRMARLRQLGISPIAGLLHHGSGPPWTNMLDPDFPKRFADYAVAVAERYPWLSYFTPVNEPVTTARISGLYGLWFPHGREESTFLQLVMAQCRATSSAMKAIRQKLPHALLMQTEDFGRVFSTPPLYYQAEYENERRWLGIDLLAGRITPSHRFYGRLVDAGVPEAHLQEFMDEPCSPDIIGIDYYLTSDRMLDHRLHLHEGETPGGNGIDSYVDVAAVRSDLPGEQWGLGPRLAEVWQRYGLPIVISELHNGCTREEQLRWFVEGWKTARQAQQGGMDIRAVTSWSLFGASDWDSMLVNVSGRYECGAFDVRGCSPRPTIVARAIAALAATSTFDHPALDQPGWWRRPADPTESSRPVALSGFGHVMSLIVECCRKRGLRVISAGSETDVVQLQKRQNVWALIRVEHSPSNATRLLGSVPSGPERDRPVFIELPLDGDWKNQLDTFLDLLVDAVHLNESENYPLSAIEPQKSWKRRKLPDA